ncbi:helix-turn-helix domain-containing protein [Halobaculum sp. MBLA0147]|uniref:helix-turn-helix domain-containing protein n=1 Tax=Halobaculum sp. MBLA0147 TaxID=3079934 RepID=UPI003523B1BB
MANSIDDYLQEDLECEGLLECFYGLKELDRVVFDELASAEEALTVDEIAERIDRERSTAYRSVRRLVDTGFVEREQINYDQGGYYHVFTLTNPDEVADELNRMLNDWYAQVGQLINRYRDEFDEPPVVANS